MLLLPVLFALFEQGSNEPFELMAEIGIFTTMVWCLFDTPEPSFQEEHLSWKRYSDKHNRQRTFKCQLCMTQESFEKLLS
jgi:hypothetical protein